MSFSLRPFASMLVVAALSACGGGGSGGGGGGGGGVTPTGTQMSLTLSGTTPSAVAVSVGGGAFTPVSVTGGSVSFTIPTGATTYQVAIACPPLNVFGTITIETVLQATISDGTTAKVSPCYGPPAPTATITGSFDVSAIAGAASAYILGNQGSQFYGTTTGSFSFNVTPGTNDVAVEALDATSHVLAVKIARAQTAPGSINGGATIALTAADNLVATPLTINNIPAGWPVPTSSNDEAFTANGTRLVFSGTGTQYMALAGADSIASDYYVINANEPAPGTSNLISNTQYTSGGAVTLTWPTPLLYAGPTATAWPSFALTYTGFSAMPFVNYYGQISWPTGATTQNEIGVYATPAYLGATTTVTIPDLSAISGFFNHAASGATVTWFTSVTGGTYQSFIANTVTTGSSSYVQGRGTYIEP